MISNETLESIRQRRSIRSYRAEQIKDDELQAIVEAGLWAPRASDQLWHFTVVQDRNLLNRLDLAAKEAARQLPIEHLRRLGNDEAFHCLYGAPVLVIVSAPEQSPIPLEADCAAAMENLLLAAQSVGLGSCWIFFVLLAFSSARAAEFRRELRIPDGYKPYYSAVFGYASEPAPAPPERKPDLITYVR